MVKVNVARWAKGSLVSAGAAGACYWLWVRLREWAQGTVEAGQGAMGAGLVEGLLAGALGLLSMPVLLWAAMRVLGERRNHVLVLGGLVVWWPIGGHVVEEAVSDAATALYLALFAVAGGLLSLAGLPKD